MTKTLVRTFIAVAKYKSISKAAATLYISPPAVSKQLSSFEKETGVVCFKRMPNGMNLTPGGKILLDYYEKSEEEFRAAVDRARAANNLTNSVLRVGVREDWNIADVFPEALADFRKMYPGIDIALNIFRDDALISGLINKSLDFVVATKNCITRNRNVPYYPLTTITRGPLMAADHPLAKKEDLNIGDLKDELFFLVHKADEPEGKSGAHELLKASCEKYGYVPKVQFVPSVISAYSMVLDKRGVIMVSDWTIQRYNPSYKYVPQDECSIEIGASWLPGDLGTVKQSFYSCLKDSFAE
ncbi:MAG: LysR family transcriptional regulator [Firmicutes bacterium]|nr:LysR family transcriptional regulator [Bacillota bacterium]